ncbi:MAG: YwmB family TATA-box binding protein [Syntrophomonadaceae bacterium]
MKKIMMYLIIFTVCVALCEHRIDYAAEKQKAIQSPIRLAFASIGAISFESRLDSWAKINTAASPQELDQIMEAILNNLNLTVTEIRSENLPQSSHREYQVEQGTSTLRLTAEADYQTDCTAIIFTCINHDGESDPGGWVPKLDNIKNWDWHHYYLYSGYLSDPAKSTGQTELLQVVMNNLDARTKEIYADKVVCSQTGYSKKLNEMVSPVWVENHKMNVQTAIRSQSDGRALLLIGSPLILGEY